MPLAVGAALAFVASVPALPAVSAAGALGYFGTQAAISAAETGLEYAITPEDEWAGSAART